MGPTIGEVHTDMRYGAYHRGGEVHTDMRYGAYHRGGTYRHEVRGLP